MNEIIWHWKSFSELSKEELYLIIAAREEVFVVEQGLNYVDCDGMDQKAFHLFGTLDGAIVTYLRVLSPGIKYPEASFGRVLNTKIVRGKGVGKELVKRGMEKIGNVPVKISAQSYLRKFYEDFGFKVICEEYLEEGIPHLKMIRA